MDMQHWKEIPQDWQWTGDPERINIEIRVNMARRNLTREKVAAILGLKRQAFARRLKGETSWRYSELDRLATEWGFRVWELIRGENRAIPTDSNNHP